jgi:hypothetical protein
MLRKRREIDGGRGGRIQAEFLIKLSAVYQSGQGEILKSRGERRDSGIVQWWKCGQSQQPP